MRIAHFGTFDVENYGDLLFPLLLERRLRDLCEEFVHVSPVGGPPVWGDCVKSVAFDELLREPRPIDGVIVGGGHIIHASPTNLESHDRGGLFSFLAYPSLWLGAAYLASREEIPLCWNGPGVPREFAPISGELLQWAASVSDYISVRDGASRDLLEKSGVRQQIHVVPDTALEVSRLWTGDELSEAYKNAFTRMGRSLPERTLAFHLNERYVTEDTETVASRLDRICDKLGATAILIAMGPCHGDDELQRRVAQKMGSEPLVIDHPQSLREVAACVARSEAYLGSSLHGMITACSFGRRGMLVASEKTAGFKKFTDFLEQFNLSPWLSESWAEAEQRIDELFAAPADVWEGVLESATPALDRHWQHLRAALESGSSGPAGTTKPTDSHPALERLRNIGEKYSGEGEIFQGIIVENLMGTQTKLQRKNEEASALKRKLQESQTELRQRENEVSRLKNQLSEKERQISELGEEVARRSREVSMLTRWMERMSTTTSSLLGSRRWKAANLLGDLLRRVLLKPPAPTAVDAINEVNRDFRAWERYRIKHPGEEYSGLELRKSLSGKPDADTPAGDAGPETGERTKVSVLAWDLGHNPMGRAYLLAEALSRKFDVEIVGAKFPHHGAEVWGPLRDGEIPVIDFAGQDFPAHFAQMESLAREIDGDVILVSKPRLPSYELGILAKQFDNRPLILDVDDYELSFFREREALTLKDAGELQEDREFLSPYANLWTRYCDGLIPLADGLTVSNEELQKRYGGEIVPHARDERTFDPALYDRDAIRAKFGFTPEDRVILFIGTPRSHKGVVDIAEALERIGDPRYKLCIIGTVKGRDLRKRLQRLEGDHVRLFDDQPYQDLAANLAVGDLVCLLQDPESEISKYQTPAKFTDALAMGIPMLATDAPPLRNLASEGLVEPLGDAPLHQKFEEIFSNYAEFKEKALKNRETFLAEYSYAAAAEKLEEVILPLLRKPPPVPKGFKRLARFHRQVFSSPQIGPGEKPEIGAGSGSGYTDDRYDIVFFWKQNDTGIYGRRQDMLVKYLAGSPRINKIIHFDAPIDSNTLLSLPEREGEDGTDQSDLVFHQTVSRLTGQKHSEKVKHYTFVRNPEALRNRPGISRPAGWSPPERRNHLQYVADVLKENGIGERRTIFWVCPVTKFDFREVVAAFGPDLVVADVIDDQRTFKEPGSPQRDANERNYEQVLSLSDVTLANCEPVRQSMLEYADDVHLIPNALEMPEAAAADPEPPKELQDLEGPVIGYVGNLSSRIDVGLLEHVATSRPGWNLVLIGSTHLSKEVLRLDVYDNVHFLGVKEYPEAQRYIRGFDVAVVPHLDNEMTRSMNPLKAFVYLSLNVPVVSTEVGNLGELRQMVHVAQDREDFVHNIELALEERDGELSAEHVELLRRNSWEERMEKILGLIEEELSATPDPDTILAGAGRMPGAK